MWLTGVPGPPICGIGATLPQPAPTGLPMRAAIRTLNLVVQYLPLDRTLAALADPTRRQVVRSLSRQPELTASRLAGELPMTRQAVTKHLAALDRAGLVSARREGRETRYTLTPAPLTDAMRWMDDVGAEWDARLARLADRR